MNAEKLLSQCRKVKETGHGTWIACCPAHEDKNPSMTVRETGEGCVLVHCFAGCAFESILVATGLQAHELFPSKLERDFSPALKRRFPAADVLLMVEREMDIVQIVADDIVAGRFKSEDAKRVRLSRKRIREAMKLAGIEQEPWRPKIAK